MDIGVAAVNSARRVHEWLEKTGTSHMIALAMSP
jgi:hypothetical protein